MGHKILSQKTRDLVAAHGEDFVILAYTILTQYSSVTDRRMNRQTPRTWLRCVLPLCVKMTADKTKSLIPSTERVRFINTVDKS